MTENTDIRIRLDSIVADKLERVAATTRRSKMALAEEAIAAYVDRELSIIDGIKQGLSDIKAGNVASHAEAMSELRDTIRESERKHRM